MKTLNGTALENTATRMADILTKHNVFGVYDVSNKEEAVFLDFEKHDFVSLVNGHANDKHQFDLSGLEMTYRGSNVRLIVHTVEHGKKATIDSVKVFAHPTVNHSLDYDALQAELDAII